LFSKLYRVHCYELYKELPMKNLLLCLFLSMSLLLTSCSTVLDESFGYRGPILVTVETLDGSKPEFPFVITSYYAETMGHGGGGPSGYDHLRLGYVGEPVAFPREKLDLLSANGYASIHFRVTHPGYRYELDSRGIGPSKADEPIKITLKVKSIAMFMDTQKHRAQEAKKNMASLMPDSPEHFKQEVIFEQQRYNLGRAIKTQIGQTKDRYLPQLTEEMQQAVIKKYDPIFKSLFYSVPETDCYKWPHCQKYILKPRTYEYKGL